VLTTTANPEVTSQATAQLSHRTQDAAAKAIKDRCCRKGNFRIGDNTPTCRIYTKLPDVRG
jgi:hypothetical protein